MGNWHWRYYYSGITRKLAKELEIYVCLRATTTSTLTFKPTSLAGAKRVLIYQWTASWERKGKPFEIRIFAELQFPLPLKTRYFSLHT